MENYLFNIGIVKIGTDVITDRETGTLRHDVICSIAKQIATMRKFVRHIILVTSGAVAAGRKEMEGIQIPASHDQDALLQLEAAMGQPLLHGAYETAFHDNNMRAIQVLLTKADFTRKDFQGLFHLALQIPEVVPIVNENDAVCTDEISGKFTDNDQLACHLAEMVRPDFVAFLTSTDGVLADIHDSESTISLLRADDEIPASVTDNSNGNGRGGMRRKIQNLQSLARKGILGFILEGGDSDVLPKALRGEPVGTLIYPERMVH